LEGLRALIRDPKSVRTWPGQQMPGFMADQMSDSEIDLVIGYLKHMAARGRNAESQLQPR
jgi:mono/diheme cytochrome c family protein